MILNDEDITDLLTGTTRRLGRGRWNQVAQRLQRYEVMGRMLKRDKAIMRGGTAIERRIQLKLSDAARMTGLYDKDNVNVADILTKMVVPWRHTTSHYAYERREVLEQKGGQEITNLVKLRRADSWLALAELMEDQVWGAPSSSSNVLDVMGIPWWVQKGASQGFTGQNPSGWTTTAEIDASAEANWRNYSDTYTDITKTDLIKKMRKARRKVKFESPVSIRDYRRGRGDTMRIYVNEDTINEMELVGEAQNENLGRDLASLDGTLVFKRNPIIEVPKLADDSSNPIYMLNWAYIELAFLAGDVLRETDPRIAADMHNVWVVFVDLTWNLLNTDRRRQAVLYVA